MIKRLLFIIILCLSISNISFAQTPNYNTLMNQAKSYFDQKEYAKAIDCYEKVVAELKGTEYESMIPTVRNGIAINNLYLGIASLKEKDYPTAKSYLENAIKDAKPESKTYFMANSWMGQWNSVQALNIRMSHGNFEQAVQFSLEAERYFDLAKAPEKRLNEQIARAAALQELLRNDEAETLLKQIISECKGFNNRSYMMGKAEYKLGDIEVGKEQFQFAIQHLEESYNLCNSDTPKDAKTWAYLASNKLCYIYSNIIPDSDKAHLWKQRADELESQTLK